MVLAQLRLSSHEVRLKYRKGEIDDPKWDDEELVGRLGNLVISYKNDDRKKQLDTKVDQDHLAVHMLVRRLDGGIAIKEYDEGKDKEEYDRNNRDVHVSTHGLRPQQPEEYDRDEDKSRSHELQEFTERHITAFAVRSTA